MSGRPAFRSGAVSREPVMDDQDLRRYFLLSACTAFSMLWFVAAWMASDRWETQPLLMATLSLSMCVLIAEQQSLWLMLPAMRRPAPKSARRGWKVGVVTTHVPGAESIELLERTVRALVALDYPHETWVLDEGDRADVRALCARLGARYYSRAAEPAYRTESGPFQFPSKHGNYNAWLHEIAYARYDIVTAFDPDHVPAPAFLGKVLGYFDDPRVGYVQTPQAYSNQAQSLVARGAAEETYGFYSIFQMACFGRRQTLVIGCHNTHRVRALQGAGGFAAHDADDLLLSLHYQRLGWEGVYVPEVLARGLTPTEWGSYLRQQRRWARAILDLKFRTMPQLLPMLPWRVRLMGAVQGLSFLLTSGAFVAQVIGSTWLMLTGRPGQLVSTAVLASGAAVMAATLLCRRELQRFYLDPEREGGWHWRAAVLQLVKFPWVLLALADVVLHRHVPYVTTPKTTPEPVEARAA